MKIQDLSRNQIFWDNGKKHQVEIPFDSIVGLKTTKGVWYLDGRYKVDIEFVAKEIVEDFFQTLGMIFKPEPTANNEHDNINQPQASN